MSTTFVDLEYFSQYPLEPAEVEAKKRGFSLALPLAILGDDVNQFDPELIVTANLIFARALEKLNPKMSAIDQLNTEHIRRESVGDPVRWNECRHNIIPDMLKASILAKMKAGEAVPNSWKGIVLEDVLGL